MALPGDMKAKILESVSGVDLAKVECTCKELKDLAADKNLWERKFELELNTLGEGSRWCENWKKRFGEAWTRKVASRSSQKRPKSRFMDYGWGSRSRTKPKPLEHGSGYQRRNISPSSNFGGHLQGFP
jgi:F-box protein 7